MQQVPSREAEGSRDDMSSIPALEKCGVIWHLKRGTKENESLSNQLPVMHDPAL
jgi:hypothetical protein